MSSKLMLALFVTAVLVTSIATVTIPAASALTARTTFNDAHCTQLYHCGPKICGDHMCAPGEYDKMKQEIVQAQMKGKTAPAPSYLPTQTPTTMPPMNATSTTTTPMSVCDSVKATLTNAGMPSTLIAKVLADLSCS